MRGKSILKEVLKDEDVSDEIKKEIKEAIDKDERTSNIINESVERVMECACAEFASMRESGIHPDHLAGFVATLTLNLIDAISNPKYEIVGELGNTMDVIHKIVVGQKQNIVSYLSKKEMN